LPPKDEAAPAEDPPSSDTPQHPKSDAKPDEVSLDVTRYKVSPGGSYIAIIAAGPQTPGEKAQKEAKSDAEWVNHNPHGSRLYVLNVASGKLMLLPVDPDVREPVWSSDGGKLLALSEGRTGWANEGFRG
jgi:hypothetical protein